MNVSFTKEFLLELKSSVNMLELARRYTELKKTGNNSWQGKCPHPGHNDSTPSFTVWDNTNRWTCFGCRGGKTSDCIDFMMWMNNWSFQEAVIYLAEEIGLEIPTYGNDSSYKKLKKENDSYINNMNDEIRNYLYVRGLSDEDISKFKIGFDNSQKRITFPLLDKNNNVTGFIKRTLLDGKAPKYINSCNSETFNKSKYLYNLNNLDKDFKFIRITEGTMDAIMATKYGAKNVVATLGTALTKNHVDIIKSLDMTPVLIYDSDNAGVKASKAALKLFYNNGVYCKICPIKENKDLCDLSLDLKDKIEDYIDNNSMTYGFSMVKDIITSYNKDIYEVRLKYSKKVDNVIKQVPEYEKEPINNFFIEEIKKGLASNS